MEQISISQISDPNKQQPFTGLSLEFLQNASHKNIAGVVEALVTKIVGSYSLTVPYIISGCVLSDSNKDVTNGTLFYGGKFYEVIGVNGTTNVARFILNKTQDATADPVTFSDSTTGNVHDIYKYVATDAASGGDFTANNLVYLSATSSVIAQQITLASQTTSSTTYVDMTGLTYTTPNDGISRKYKLSLIGDAELSAVSGTTSGVGAKFQIYNDTDSTSLDIRRYELSVIFPVGSGDVVGCLPINCGAIVTLNPAKVIKCRMLNDADGVTVKECKFLLRK